MKSEKSLTYQNNLNEVTIILNEQSKQCFDATQKTSSSNWLSAALIKEYSFEYSWVNFSRGGSDNFLGK